MSHAAIWAVLFAAALLSLERRCYIWAWKAPSAFRAVCVGTPIEQPIDALQALFVGFKVLQLAVFVGWCVAYGDGNVWPPDGGGAIAVGAALAISGQTLNLGVFYRLGTRGVFYGNRFGRETSWCRAFPFSFCRHPQYVGTLLSIWGFFLIMRFPHDDGLVIPIIETVYYAFGALAEQ